MKRQGPEFGKTNTGENLEDNVPERRDRHNVDLQKYVQGALESSLNSNLHMHKVEPHDTGEQFLRKEQLPESFKTNNSRTHLGPEVFQIPSNPCGEISLNLQLFIQ